MSDDRRSLRLLPAPPKASTPRLDIVNRHINVKWKDKACPRCGLNNWHFEDGAHLPCPSAGSVLGQARGIPVVILVCRECGHLELMSSVYLGLERALEEVKT